MTSASASTKQQLAHIEAAKILLMLSIAMLNAKDCHGRASHNDDLLTSTLDMNKDNFVAVAENKEDEIQVLKVVQEKRKEVGGGFSVASANKNKKIKSNEQMDERERKRVANLKGIFEALAKSTPPAIDEESDAPIIRQFKEAAKNGGRTLDADGWFVAFKYTALRAKDKRGNYAELERFIDNYPAGVKWDPHHGGTYLLQTYGNPMLDRKTVAWVEEKCGCENCCFVNQRK